MARLVVNCRSHPPVVHTKVVCVTDVHVVSDPLSDPVCRTRAGEDDDGSLEARPLATGGERIGDCITLLLGVLKQK
jgi:hypothetical protein